MTIQPEFAMVQTNGIRLRVALAGKGPLVCWCTAGRRAGTPGGIRFRPLLKRAIAWRRLMSVAMASSDKPAAIEAYAIKEMCADIAGLVESLGERQAILVGHDWGAPIVWNTSLFFPQRFGRSPD